MKFLGLFLMNLLALVLLSLGISFITLLFVTFIFDKPMLASAIVILLFLGILAFFATKSQMDENK